MDGDNRRAAATRRVTLSDGGWADVRLTQTVADLRAQREAAHLRGYEDPLLDTLDTLPRFVVAWSYGDQVTREGVDALPIEDALALVRAINEGTESVPNPSGASSAGTRAKPTSRRSNG